MRTYIVFWEGPDGKERREEIRADFYVDHARSTMIHFVKRSDEEKPRSVASFDRESVLSIREAVG